MEARLNLASQETGLYEIQQTFKNKLNKKHVYQIYLCELTPILFVDRHGVLRRKKRQRRRRRGRAVCPYDPSFTFSNDFHYKIGEDYKKKQK